MQTLNLSTVALIVPRLLSKKLWKLNSEKLTLDSISHGFLIEETKKKLDANGFDVVNENHNLARFGQRYFGLMQVQDRNSPENPDRATVVGLRNGHDKCFPAGIMAGDAPFVCSNLIFNNEIVIARRHTKNIDNVNVAGNIFHKIANAIGQLRESWLGQEERVNSYKDYDLSSTSEATISSLGFIKMVLVPKLRLLMLPRMHLITMSSRIGICTLFTIPFLKCEG